MQVKHTRLHSALDIFQRENIGPKFTFQIEFDLGVLNPGCSSNHPLFQFLLGCNGLD